MPPWCRLVNEDYDKELKKYRHPELLATSQAKMKALMKTHIEEPLLALAKKPKFTLHEELQFVILSMLHPDPAKRIVLTEALDRVSYILAISNEFTADYMDELFSRLAITSEDEKSDR